IPGYSASRVLGRGGFGIVVQATRVSDGLPVAIKIAHRDNAQAATRLEVEAEPLRSIGPPFVPALYEEGNLPNGSRYLVMELINLPRLAERLSELPCGMEMDEFLTRATTLLDAVDSVHRNGYVHRDLKPENIFSTAVAAQTKLIDFGLVRRSDRSMRL